MNSKSSSKRPRPTEKRALDIVGKCPKCGSDVVVGAVRYHCINFHYKGKDLKDTLRNQCFFAIYRNQLKKIGKDNITLDEMRSMLKGQPVRLEGLIRKDGATFDTYGLIGDRPTYGWGIIFVRPSALVKPTPPPETPLKRRIVINRNRTVEANISD